MNFNPPLVSIGMPTYNAARFIGESLDSLLLQDFEDFEIVISDNASTDSTYKICLDYASRDPRIRCYRNQTCIGMTRNFNRAFELSRGKYFMWAADHDLWDKSFIRKCLHALETEHEVVLCYPQTMLIDINGKPLGIMPDRIDTRSLDLIKRFRQIISELSLCNMVYGLIRTDTMRKTKLFPANVIAPDQVFLVELSLLGTFAQVAEPLFLRRQNRGPENHEQRVRRGQSYLDPTNTGRSQPMPLWSLWQEHLSIAVRAAVNPIVKLKLLWLVLRYYPTRHPATMVEELVEWPLSLF